MPDRRIDDMDEDSRLQAMMGILMMVDRTVIESGGQWTFEAIDAKDDIVGYLTGLFGVNPDRVEELVEAGDGDLPA